MKKGIIIGIIVGVLITSGVGVVAYSYNAKDVGYTPKDTTWKVNNVKEAIDYVYELADLCKFAQYIDHKMLQDSYTLVNGGTYYFVVTSYSTKSQETAKGYTAITSVSSGTYEEISSLAGGSGYWSRVYKIVAPDDTTVTFKDKTNFAIFK